MTDTPTPAELLTAAADRLEQLITEATPGPWTAHDDGLVWPERMGDPVSGSAQLADAEFIAAMSPTVGRALVALLRGMAFWYFGRGPEWPLGTDSLQALARAILGETS